MLAHGRATSPVHLQAGGTGASSTVRLDSQRRFPRRLTLLAQTQAGPAVEKFAGYIEVA